MKKIFGSLTARLCVYIIVITVVIFCSIAFVFGKYSTNREEHNAERYTSVLLQNMQQKIDRKLADVESTVAATLPVVQKSLNAPDDLMSIIEKMVWDNGNLMGGCVAFEPHFYSKKGERFMEYVSLDTLNNVYRKHLGDDDSYNYLKMQWYTEAKNAGQGIWSEPYFDEGGGNILMTTYTLPMLDKNGRFYGVITADISLEDMVKGIDAIRPFPDSYSFILSKKGVFISFPNRDYILKECGSFYSKELDNKDMDRILSDMVCGGRGTQSVNTKESELLACYAPILRTGWSICCICPYKTIMQDLGTTILTILMILLVGLIVLLICIRAILVYSMKPMKELTEAAYIIAKGCFDNPLPVIDSKDEMKKLHDAFAFMQRSLKGYTAELEATTRSKERIESELNIAKEIQMNMIPRHFSPFAECGSLDLYALLEPAKEVSGDLYDFFIRKDKLFFTIGDVSGKGIPASLVMSITCTLFRVMAEKYESPAEIAKTVNAAISNRNDANMFVTMFFGVLDLKSGSLEYCNAGHNPPVIVSNEGNCKFVEILPNLPIGILDGFEYISQTMTLPVGATLLLYTDGITEAENCDKEQFGEQQLLNVVKDCSGLESKEILCHLLKEVKGFTGAAEQSDDITALCIKLTGK